MTLWVKALRDLLLHKGAFLACMFMLTLGIMTFAALNQVSIGLERAQQAFYANMRFADAFASVQSMPAAAAEALARIEGIEAAQGRLCFMVRVMTDKAHPVSLRVYSYDPGAADALNDIYIVEGAKPKAGERAMLLTEGYASANGIGIGDEQTLIINGARTVIPVAGLAEAPDQVYVLPPDSDMLPNDEGYGVAYMPRDVVEQLFGVHGMVNDISLLLDGATPFALLRSELEGALQPFGLLALYARDDQISHAMLDLEITQMGNMVGVVPTVFLLIGFFMTIIIIKRIVEQQRMQIGLLKSLGYSALSVLAHYGMIGGVIGLGASAAGVALGALMSGAMMDLMKDYFYMPGIYGALSASDVVVPVALTLAVAVAASVYAARGSLRLRAAEAMRPPAPQVGRRVWLERLGGLWRAMSTTLRLCLRNMLRRPVRTAATAAGVVVSYALITALCSMAPLMEEMIGYQFAQVQTYDLKVTLNKPADATRTQRAVSALPGVAAAEGVLELPAVLRKGANNRAMTLLGLEHPSTLYYVFDEDKHVIALGDGLVINTRAASVLGVKVGDELTLELPSVGREARVQVAALAMEYMGMNAYMSRAAMARLIGADAVTGVHVGLFDVSAAATITDSLADARNVADAVSASQMMASIQDTFDTQMGLMNYIAVIAMACGFAILYNQGVVSLSERTRELASMRIMGFSIGGAASVLIIEQAVLAALGSALGVPFAYALLSALMDSVNGDSYSIPVVIPVSAYVVGAVCVAAAVALNAILMFLKVKRLNMVEALKDRE